MVRKKNWLNKTALMVLPPRSPWIHLSVDLATFYIQKQYLTTDLKTYSVER